MDISELLPILVGLLIAVLAGVGFWSSRRLAARSLRVALKVGTGLLVGAGLLVAASLTYFNLRYTRHLPAIVSPDGRHVALITYTVDTGTGIDEAEVALRHSWLPYSYRVYAGPTAFDPDAAEPEPDAQWMDATHLTVRFKTYISAASSPGLIPEGCAETASGITIRCEETRVHVRR